MEKVGLDHHSPFTDPTNPSSNDSLNTGDGTVRDAQDMHRMGKQQLFQRNFRFYSIFAFTMILLSTWEALLATSAFGLQNGGTAGWIYVYVGAFVGFVFVILSMAEMASMAPTAGGQYHWISEFAPPSTQKFLSYLIGWLCVLGWQTGCAAGSFLAATYIQGIVVLNYPNYEYERWQGTLMTIAVILLVTVFNTFFIRTLPILETFALVLHLGGFLGFLIPVWVMGSSQRQSSTQVWTGFTDGGDWASIGLSCLVGIISPITALIGSDSAAHLSEELTNASKSLPRAMVLTAVVNGSLGFVVLITFSYNTGDLTSLLSTPTGYPFIQLFYNCTGSIAGTTAITSIIAIISIFNAAANLATSSRQLFAFARDNGFPFKSLFASVTSIPTGINPARTTPVPLAAILFTVLVSSALACINIGSTIAYNQIISLGVCALLSSYLVSISCMALKRIRNEPLLSAHFTLGPRYLGLFVNIMAIGFLMLAYVMVFFPPVRDPNLQEMNWAVAVYGGVVLLSLGYYVVWGRKRYVGPVEYVRKLS